MFEMVIVLPLVSVKEKVRNWLALTPAAAVVVDHALAPHARAAVAPLVDKPLPRAMPVTEILGALVVGISGEAPMPDEPFTSQPAKMPE